MRKIIASLIISLILTATVVIAQEEGLPTPGLLPDNPFYPIKTFFERVRLWITFNNEERAKLRLQYANLRLSELNEMVKQQKLQYVESLRNRYEDELRGSEAEMNRSLALGRNITALAEHVCNMSYKHVLVLERILEKAPNASKPVIERVMNASIERHEICAERILARLNKTEEELKWRFNCTADVNCTELECPELRCAEDKCPVFEPTCIISPYKTKGVCMCMPKINETFLKLPRRFNCTVDTDCSNILSCPTFMQPTCYMIHNMTRGVCICMPISCESDTDCSELNCAEARQPACIIPKNKTKGFCFCKPANCSIDFDCRHLICPMVLGHDTPICEEGKCKCGAKWEITNKTEWRERFREELNNETQKRMEKIKQMWCLDPSRCPICRPPLYC